MTSRTLLDTGFIVAIVNDQDPWHEQCHAVAKDLTGELLTVEGVIVEAAWLLRRIPHGPRRAVDAVLDSGARIVPPTVARLHRAVSLMNRYADVPMDFVDAELVALAEEEQLSRILTLDRRGFRTYRIHGKRKFQLLPV